MTFSNLNRILSVLFLGLALAACSTQSDKKKDVVIDNPEKNFGRSPGTNFLVDALKSNGTIPEYSKPYGSKIVGKLYNFEACIKDPSNAAVQPNIKFEIDSEDGNTIPTSTDLRGCLTWTESHKINFFAEESYIQFRRVVRGKGIYKGEVFVEIAIHPWSDGAASVVDLRYNQVPANQPVKKVGKLSVKGSTLTTGEAMIKGTLKGASFEYLGNDISKFEVTPFLGLKVAHKYRVKITPMLYRRSIAKYWEAVSLLTGDMKVDFTVLREDENPATQFDLKNVITTVSWTGTMEFGDLNALISVQFDNVSDITSRTIALVTLTPLDEISDLGQMSFTGAMKPGQLGAVNLYPVAEQNATRLNAAYVQKLNESPRHKLKAVDLYKTVNEVQPLVLKSFQTNGQVQVDRMALLEQYLATGTFGSRDFTMRAALCDALLDTADARTHLDRCRTLGSKYLTLSRRSFVDTLNSKRPTSVGMPTVDTLTMTAGVGESYRKSTTVSQSVKASAGLSAGLGFGDSGNPLAVLGGMIGKISSILGFNVGFKVSLGANRDYGVAWVSSIENSTGVSTGARTKTVTAEGQTYEIDVNVRKCLIVKRNPEAFETGFFRRDIEVSAKTAIYCSDKVVRELKQETYYLVGQKVGADGSVFTDTASNGATPWRMFIRGKPVMNVFSQILSQSNLEFRVQQMTEDSLSENFKEFYVTQEFPGVLSE